ncbi:MAG: domain containing protein [Verrucomicrobiaceae bacterium]|nr:domain containing protein [Verrucomicrobiaceae bacterium]
MKILSLLTAGVLLQSLTTAHAANVFYRSLVLGDGALSYFQFEEAAGTIAVNTVTTGPNGTYNGSIALAAAGRSGLGLAPTFTNGNVIVPSAANTDFGVGAPFSIEFWFNEPTGGRGDLLTHKGGGADFGIHSQSEGDGTVSFYNGGFVGTATPASLAVWHHLVLTRSAANNYTLYLDNVAKALGAGPAYAAGIPLLIGSNTSNGADIAIPFTGQMDEFALYGSALTQAQVSAHFLAAPEPSRILFFAVAGLLCGGRRRRD